MLEEAPGQLHHGEIQPLARVLPIMTECSRTVNASKFRVVNRVSQNKSRIFPQSSGPTLRPSSLDILEHFSTIWSNKKLCKIIRSQKSLTSLITCIYYEEKFQIYPQHRGQGNYNPRSCHTGFSTSLSTVETSCKSPQFTLY